MRKATQSVNYLAAACNYIIILHTHIVIWLFVLIMWNLRLSKRNDPSFPLKLLAAHFKMCHIHFLKTSEWSEFLVRHIKPALLVSLLPISLRQLFSSTNYELLYLNTIFSLSRSKFVPMYLQHFLTRSKKFRWVSRWVWTIDRIERGVPTGKN